MPEPIEDGAEGVVALQHRTDVSPLGWLSKQTFFSRACGAASFVGAPDSNLISRLVHRVFRCLSQPGVVIFAGPLFTPQPLCRPTRMDKGSALNKRVWTLFEQAGFTTKPSAGSSAEYSVAVSPRKKFPVDLLAWDDALGVKILGSNKSGTHLHWSEHVELQRKLGEKAKADKVLFVVTGKELGPDEKAELKEQGMILWTEEELAYYEALVASIGRYAKYEIIHDFGLETHEERSSKIVLAIRLRQPTNTSNTQLFLFSACPDWLLKTCTIYRRALHHRDAYQRMLNRKRLPKIRKFVTQADAILPTNLIVHLGDDVVIDELEPMKFKDGRGRSVTITRPRDYDLVALHIPMKYASLELIDGQHRLYGFVNTDQPTKEHFNLVVLGIVNMSPKQRSGAFVAINDNSRRMDPNLVAYLKYTKDDIECQADNALMAIRLVVELNQREPFKKRIRLLDVGDQQITLKGFSGYDLKGLLGPRGLLRKYYQSNTPEIYTEVLQQYFAKAAAIFRKEWNDPKKYILATNRGISALLKLLKSMLKHFDGPLTEEQMGEVLAALKSGGQDWDYDTLKSKYVGSQGWKQLHGHLVEIIQKKYPDFDA